MEDQKEQTPDGWEARDLTSGVAKVFAAAKRRSMLGIQAATAWAVVVFIYGCLGIVGAVYVAPPWWDFAAGVAMVLLAATSVSRTPGPLLGASILVLVDLGVVSFQFPSLVERGTPADYLGAGIRAAAAPLALFFVVNGYFGCLAIQAFKNGFSPGADWRTRMSPMMLQLTVVGSCVGVVLVGFLSWMGAIRSGFARTDAVWVTRSLPFGSLEIETARPDAERAETDGKTQEDFIKVKVLEKERAELAKAEVPVPEYPEAAKPILNLKGFDAYGQRVLEDAFEFGGETDEPGCVLEAQGRQDRCRDDRCKHWARMFARACLTKSKRAEQYCKEVPEPTLLDAGARWAEGLCAGRLFETCRELLFAVQGHCHPPVDPSKAADANKAPAKSAPAKQGAAK
ncbi:MAG: hypothetical protein ABR538_10065 [Candidatus Binatia bacterium]